MLQSDPTREGILEEVVQWRKFDRVKNIALEILDSNLTTDKLQFFLSFLTSNEYDDSYFKDEQAQEEEMAAYKELL